MSDFETDFADLTPLLLKQGWLFPPKILGGELRELRRRCTALSAPPSLSTAERQHLESEIAEVLVFCAFHPNYRAYYVWLAMQQPHASAFSHLLEIAALHFFRGDFLSCIHCLLPAIEGVLRSHYAACSPKQVNDPKGHDLRAFLRSPRQVHSYAGAHELYRNALSDFLGTWLWKSTNDADWELSHLNRHYIFHGLGAAHYYRESDCHRLFIFLDLYLEMLVLETGIGEYPFIPPDPAIMRRTERYLALMTSSGLQPSPSDRLLLEEHSNFRAPRPEVLADRIARWIDIMGGSHLGANGSPRLPHPLAEAGFASHLLRLIQRRVLRWRAVAGR